MKHILISGSLRKDSIHGQILKIIAEKLQNAEVIDLNALDIPIYNQDQETPLPKGVQILGEKVAACQSLIIASPEYNYTISSVTKTIIDWLSRVTPMPLKGKCVLLVGASPSQFGAIRGLWQTRIPFEGLGNYVFPEMFSLANAFSEIENGQFTDPKQLSRLEKILTNYTNFCHLFAKS